MESTKNLVTQRLRLFQAQLPPATAVLLSDPADITYFSDFRFLVPAEREGLMVVTRDSAFLIHANFSPTVAQPGIEVLMGCDPTQLVGHFKKIVSTAPFTTLWLDTTRLFANEYQQLQKLSQLKLEPLDKTRLWQQRMVKDETEIAKITRASEIATQAWKKLKPLLKPGVTELQLQRQLDVFMFELGAEAAAFPTIVAFGAHAALPHHQPTNTVLTNNTSVLLDFGALYEGYRSDMTRTVWVGRKKDAEFEKVSHLVHQAYQAVIDRLKTHPQKTLLAQDLDYTARTMIAKAGHGSHFIHTTGHGVGLDIHEQPSIYTHNKTKLVNGMVITVEPGIYIPDSFGYRYENTVVLTSEGYRELTLEANL